ncbi:hypothetical protein [Paraclostridium sordellii]|uniref:hypothetical protein n=1 Tax=Paraclostridium sordellii TaxID=1505 RepID=UPI0005DE3057|nr:hypothetical protein [Paeniclostridium sordellii]MCR1847948.1 hypothetical protein [Paeniclostridium sordellii]CEN93706.1 Uncharacterised protein [[Clostridium] sordellii] [Paeniclostridium sordellii]CEN95117.1 Uncharacterised protein [[Clostridium] sordellii] [Paeniclostridium sordellii]
MNKKFKILIITIILLIPIKIFLDNSGEVILNEKSPDGNFSIIVKQKGFLQPYGVIVYRKDEKTNEKDKLFSENIHGDLCGISKNDVYVNWGENNEGLLHVQGESNAIECRIGLTSNGQLYEYKH